MQLSQWLFLRFGLSGCDLQGDAISFPGVARFQPFKHLLAFWMFGSQMVTDRQRHTHTHTQTDSIHANFLSILKLQQNEILKQNESL